MASDSPNPLVPGVRVPERLFTAWMTASDGLDHAVTDEQFHDHRPEPEAVCGAVIMLASMETPPGPRCARCRAFLAARESLRDLDRRLGEHRHRRPSWLGRLLHPGTPTLAVPSPRALVRDGRLHSPVDTAGSPAVVSTGLHDGTDA